MKDLVRAGAAALVVSLAVAPLAGCGGGGGDGGAPPPPPSPIVPPPPPPPPLPTTPTGLRAVTGGDSVALIWNASTAPDGAITRYSVQRDGAEIATTDAANPNPGKVYDQGARFIDTTISPGRTYTYRVQAIGGISGNEVRSELSGYIEVDTPAAGATTPVPQITVDLTEAPDLQAWTNDYVLPEVRAWYPKIADLIAYPDYAAPASIRIVYDADYDGLAYASGSDIVLNPDWPRQHPEDLGVFIHEGTHIIQSSRGFSRGWIVEGTADWAREFPYHDRDPRTPASLAGASYILGYAEGSALLGWIAEHDDPQIVRKLTVAMHRSQYTDSLFAGATGKTADQLWAEMTGVPITTGAVAAEGRPGRCVDNAGGSQDDGNKIRTWACNGTDAQLFSAVPGSDGALALRVHGKCVDVTSSGTTAGTLVQLYTCNGTAAQRWTVSGSALRNPNSGMCLDASDFADETQLRIFTCNGSAAQQWRLGAHTAVGALRGSGAWASKCAGNRVVSGSVELALRVDACDAADVARTWVVGPGAGGASTLTLDGVGPGSWCLAASGTANGAAVQIAACSSGAAGQQWVADAGRLRNPASGRCLDASSASDGTALAIRDCATGDGQKWSLPT